ncbi:carbamoyltransferase HypF [candidate division KSB3 bacterium]|uniref:Carbamoyltransferase n=1 Tax=candidate division KSB3 bacterium TaxID=2044937 RepID=A0A9D5JUA0_9BACT|nr:carbamoyltransferase HypF [candidate division KSB3 bacterium]MBD3324229.1 carbamoyltransferase HypF [candidate division KSB3 bacterium]
MSVVVEEKAFDIKVYGLVQGVGFRPFVHNLATGLNLSGWALNRNDCVQIRLQGQRYALEEFVSALQQQAPPLSKIEAVVAEETAPEALTGFQILHSQSHSAQITRVSPDVAVCQDCLHDMQIQANRIKYPFTNCTNCGPRFSIIQDLPYDRERTTMQVFRMCASCQQEYDAITDRRFHAQPNACRDCGPAYELLSQGQRISEIEPMLQTLCQLITAGQIVAIKGIGGFHLACDATNEAAVARLRTRKLREGKPFAVMVENLETARQYAQIDADEQQLLCSEKRPILLVNQRRDQEAKTLAPAVAQGLDTLGIMLPYTPLHYLLFERLSTDALVLTSGNRSEEPICIGNDAACESLAEIADAFLVYNREIHNRSDDSVASVVRGTPRLLRRSRGWVPEPIAMPFPVEGIIAVGAELKNCFCVGKGIQAILSQHIGDLKNREIYTFYQEAIERFTRLFRVEPELIACDLHPDYLSTRYAQASGLPTVPVQHHHAHIASCLAEFNLDEPVIGISFDGTGLGDDRKIWGGECLICDLTEYERFSHLEYVPMPGGDKAAEEPWRMGIAYLYQTFGKDFRHLELPFLRQLDMQKVDLLVQAMERGINCPQTSSVGRLFDAVAAMINLCLVARFEAEAPIRLESLLGEAEARNAAASRDHYPYEIGEQVSVKPLIQELVTDIEQQLAPAVISLKLHQTLVAILVDLAEQIRAVRGINTVVLSGGVFQNRYLLTEAEQRLADRQFTVYSNRSVPANDGGICLGQIAVAAKRRERGCV